MNKINNPKREDWNDVLKRPTQTVADIEGLVNGIFKEVAEDGDITIKKYTQQFDKVYLEDLLVSDTEIEEAKNSVSLELKNAIQLCKI